ncbi:tryptophan-rich sensory protein [Candidatus Falkowbacteria bacterium]|nr:tryptophan-rich sensory protein [Candidatus Falkowbacteria bacterium]
MSSLLIKIITVISYLAMIVVNFLANGLPINNRSTGEISDAYPNLFAPAGLTFSIWGLIYLLLAGYTIYQLLPAGKMIGQKNEGLLRRINLLFILSSLANISWIFAWHYDLIGLSVVIMAIILILLIKISDIVRLGQLTKEERLFVATPFSVYFGWITVAAIANISVFLVSQGWNGFGVADYVWTSIVLLVGTLIGTLRMHKDKNIAYGMVLVWAYSGILIKHLSQTGFGGQYVSVIITTIACIVIFIVATSIIYKNRYKQ